MSKYKFVLTIEVEADGANKAREQFEDHLENMIHSGSIRDFMYNDIEMNLVINKSSFNEV